MRREGRKTGTRRQRRDSKTRQKRLSCLQSEVSVLIFLLVVVWSLLGGADRVGVGGGYDNVHSGGCKSGSEHTAAKMSNS